MSLNEDELSSWEKALEKREAALANPLTKSEEGLLYAPSNFYLKEYDALRAEILQTSTDSRTLERNIVFAFGVSLAWIMSHKSVHALVWFIPLALVCVGILRSGALLISFGLYAEYIRKLEKVLTKNGEPRGWEIFRQNRSLGIAVTAFVFWALMLGASIFVIVRKPTVSSEATWTTQIINQGNPGQQAEPQPTRLLKH